jgi:hypothetical protein
VDDVRDDDSRKPDRLVDDPPDSGPRDANPPDSGPRAADPPDSGVEQLRAVAVRLTAAGSRLHDDVIVRLADLELPPTAFPALTRLRHTYQEIVVGTGDVASAAGAALTAVGGRLAEVAASHDAIDAEVRAKLSPS